jgi:GT2 family glycosyltransferase
VAERVGDLELEVVVVDSGSTDATAGVVADHPPARLVRCENRGFAHANNRGVEATSAPWVFFLNPDTEVIDGTLGDLVRAAEQFPGAGVFGVRQVNGRGTLEPSMRRFPHPVRWFLEAFGSERWATRDGRWSGQRVRRWEAYDTFARCDWTSGSAMLVRAEVLRVTGGMDESFFLYSEEPDLSLRALRAGWTTMHLPVLTVVHFGGNEAASPRMSAQLAYSRSQYMAKHFSRPARVLGTAALALGYVFRMIDSRKRAGSWAALETILGFRGAPFQRAVPRG